MPRKRCGYLFFAIFALAAAIFSCSSPQTTGSKPATKVSSNQNVAELRLALTQPLTSKELANLLDPKGLKSIGETCKIEGEEGLPCEGYGLVTGLGGNGADKNEEGLREVKQEVIKTLVREEHRSVGESKTLVESRDTSIVHVSGVIAAGAGPNSMFDVTLQPVDATISLEGGFLHVTSLHRYIYLAKERRNVRGDVIARASGAVTAGVVQQNVIAAEGDKRNGTVFDGGLYPGERDLIIRVEPRYASARHAVLIEYLLNKRFRDVGRQPGTPGVNYATALGSRDIMMRVPPLYRRHMQRFADVMRTIRGTYFYGAPSASEIKGIVTALEKGTPKEKYRASVALEGVGAPAAAYLQSAAQGGDDWTRLYAGTALAYLNDPQASDIIVRAADSSIEDVRFEAVRLMAQMSGRRVVEVLREKMLDPSKHVATEAIRGLIAQGGDVTQMARFSFFDMAAIAGPESRLMVVAGGRPLVAIVGPAAPLKDKVNVQADTIALGSMSDKEVGVVTGEGAAAETVTVDATVDGVLTAVARHNPPFDVMRKILAGLEDHGNLPYKIVWLE